MSESYDYIVVGAGSAGCVLANRLSADPSHRVLLLEAGGKDNNPWIHVPVGYFKTLHNPNTDWRYKTAPDPGLNGRSLDWPRGKTLGGSSSINGLLYIRGHKDDYNNWRQLGNAGWSYDDVLPYFIKSEDHQDGASDYHGAGGPLKVSHMRAKSPLMEAYIAGSAEMGVAPNTDVNGAEQEGAGYYQQTAYNGLRWSSAKAFLKPAKSRSNLTISVKSQALGLLFADNDGAKVTGLRYEKAGAEHTALLREGGEVILSTGAIGSPQILQVSGIGNGAQLQSAGVTTRLDSPGVGEHLQDHLQIRLVHEVNVATLNQQINHWHRRMMIGLNYVLRRRGPMSMGASQVYIFARSREEKDRPDIQFHIQPFSAEKPGLVMHDFQGVTTSVCQLRPESMGHIRITSPDARVYPTIQPNYLSTEGDCQTAIDSIRFSRRLMATDALSSFVVREHLPGPDIAGDDAILEAARNISQTIYHPTSTCRMGPDAMSVVDERLRVKGAQNLRVADASIMPAIVSGNTNAPTIMIGEKASDMILEDRKKAS